MLIRSALPADGAAIFDVHAAAFGGTDEAELVGMLEDDGDLPVSLVAEVDGEIAGHIAFSTMRVLANYKPWRCCGLAPVGVLPAYQRSGIGLALIEIGLNILRTESYQACFVLGDAGYYARFGFDPARAVPFVSPYAGPHFMALYLDSGLVIPQSGRADYAPAFARLERP
ncbi:GNAT family N-acetyltransferase [Blastomonas fulva]|jgi:putative acetyltransferase|uniref:GNAT family N-acetyltransferase n=1 Tax=Blastomonas fulva TaxID=1550728 RepID=UPI003D2DC594